MNSIKICQCFLNAWHVNGEDRQRTLVPAPPATLIPSIYSKTKIDQRNFSIETMYSTVIVVSVFQYISIFTPPFPGQLPTPTSCPLIHLFLSRDNLCNYISYVSALFNPYMCDQRHIIQIIIYHWYEIYRHLNDNIVLQIKSVLFKDGYNL